jgi:unsaturated rhamnogalacturonyl hydrolase
MRLQAKSIHLRASVAAGIICGLYLVGSGVAAQPQASRLSASVSTSDQAQIDAGDKVADPGPLAKDLSPAMKSRDIQHAMRKVADWQIAYAKGRYTQDWTYAPLYLGLIATSKATGDPRYSEVVTSVSRELDWKLWKYRSFHADDEAIGQAYELLYLAKPEPVKIADVRSTFDALVSRPDDPAKDLWWWCDALFMAPPAMSRLSAITKDRRYVEKMDREWQLTTTHLYDPGEHLFSRDASFLNKVEANGKKLFWSRGNGWVLAGLVDVLQSLAPDDPLRPKYLQQYREMASRIAELQQPDGLWRAGLLDQTSYSNAEISGSAFFTYAMAWGLNEGVLEPKQYAPVVGRSWRGMLQHVYQDGRLGSIQPIGAAPDKFTPSSSYVYGVGAFLMAGSEIDRYAKMHTKTKLHKR